MNEMKGVASSFTFVVGTPRKYSFRHDNLEELNVSASQCICSKLAKIKDNPGCATVV